MVGIYCFFEKCSLCFCACSLAHQTAVSLSFEVLPVLFMFFVHDSWCSMFCKTFSDFFFSWCVLCKCIASGHSLLNREHFSNHDLYVRDDTQMDEHLTFQHRWDDWWTDLTYSTLYYPVLREPLYYFIYRISNTRALLSSSWRPLDSCDR